MDKKKIELRSEKIRNIIGQVPPRIIRNGNFVLFIGYALLIIGLFFFEYPEEYSSEFTVKTQPSTLSVYAKNDGTVIFKAEDEHKVCSGDLVLIFFQTETNSIDSIYTPVSGIIRTSGNENIRKGDILYQIVPEKIEKYYGEIFLPEVVEKKINENETLKIELYQSKQKKTQLIEGRIMKIFSLPVNKNDMNYYRIIFSFDESVLKLNTEKEIPSFTKSYAIIHTENKSVIKKILETLFPVTEKK
jgi:hypothetical protein